MYTNAGTRTQCMEGFAMVAEPSVNRRDSITEHCHQEDLGPNSD